MSYLPYEVDEKGKVVFNSKKLLECLQKRYGAAKSIADLWASLLNACFHYAIPARNRFWRPPEQQGDQKNVRVYDTTAVEATKTFVSKLQDAMTPPQVQWGYLQIDDSLDNEEFADKQEAQALLDLYMKKLFKYIHNSNFDVTVNEAYFDQAIGTSCMVVNSFSDEEPLVFTSVPIDKLVIEEAMTGRIETWFRTWDNVKINELNIRWPKATITPQMLQDLKTNPDAKMKVVYEGVAYFPELPKPYVYAVWAEDSLLFFELLESNPGIVWRFQKTNNEVWGRGPVMDALPSIMSLNEMARIELASANLNTFRPYMGWSDGVFNPYTFRLEPFSVIPIAPVGSQGIFPLQPLPNSSDPNFAQFTIQDLRLQIKTLLFAETPSDSLSVQPQTAFELALRQQTLAQKIGPLFSRLQQEFLWPLIKRCAYILDKRGLLPMPKLNDKAIQFVYRSPLALAKGQEEVGRLTQWVQLLQGIMGPNVTQMYINPVKAPWLLAEALQVDPEYLNDQNQITGVAQNLQNQQSALIQAATESGEPLPTEQTLGVL